MNFKKFRWSKVYESSEEELTDFLKSRGLAATHHSGEAGSGITNGLSEAGQTIWCAEGSFTIVIGGTRYSMQPGDALQINQGLSYQIQPGIAGYIYYLT